MSLNKPKSELEKMPFSKLCAEMKATLPADAPPGQDLRLATRADGNSELKVHIAQWSDRFPSPTRQQNRQEACDLLRDALKREVGADKAAKILGAAGVADNADRISIGQMLNIEKDMNRRLAQDIGRAADRWGKAYASGVPAPTPALNEGVDHLLGDGASNWQVAGAGAGAAIIVTSQTEPSNGAILKFESRAKTQASEDISRLAQDMFAATEGKLPLQFAAVEMVEALGDETRAALTNKMEELRAISQDDRLDNHIAKTHEMKEQGVGKDAMSKMSFVDGKALDRLPLADRIALYKNPEFARQVGQATVLCPMFGLNDHVAPRAVIEGPDLGKYNHEMSMLNTGNLMINSQNGGLVAIDYSTSVTGISSTDNLIAGFKNADQAVESTAAFLEKTLKDEASLNRGVDSLVRESQSGATIDGSTPLTATFAIMSSPQSKDSFFNESERVLVDQYITPNDRAAFAKNMMGGAVDGLEFIQQNAAHFENAYQASAERAIESGRLAPGERPFMTGQQMGALQDRLNPERIATLKQQAATLNPQRGIGAHRRNSVAEVMHHDDKEDFAERLKKKLAQSPPGAQSTLNEVAKGGALPGAKKKLPPGAVKLHGME